MASYDMERSNNFTSTDKCIDERVEQLFTQCVFANQFMQDKTEKYGYIYIAMLSTLQLQKDTTKIWSAYMTSICLKTKFAPSALK